jgi:DNA-binding NarL/FixJ family response regulator
LGPQDGFARPPVPLEDRHIRIIEATAFGLRTRIIAEQLNYSPRSVDGIIQDAVKRLGVRNRPALVASAITQGFVRPVDSRRISALSGRQLLVAEGVARGDTASEIAQKLRIRERTVRAHMTAARKTAICETNSALAALVASRDVQTANDPDARLDPAVVLDVLETGHVEEAKQWLRRLRDAQQAPRGTLTLIEGHYRRSESQSLRERRDAEIPKNIDGFALRWLLTAPATTSERLRGLMALGLTPTQIAQATGVSPSTVRKWSRGLAQPRPTAATTLDDLRTTATVLLDGGFEPERVAPWFTSRHIQTGERPLDRLRKSPAAVLAAAANDALQLRA